MDYRKNIMEAAGTLFLKFGFRNTTIEDICAQLGISKKTFYEHFNNKNDLVFQMSGEYIVQSEKNYETLTREAENAIDELVIILKQMDEMFRYLNPRIIFELQRFFPESWELFEKHKEEGALKWITKNLERGITEGIFRENLNIEVIGRMRLEIGHLIFNTEIFPPEKFKLNEVNRHILEHYLYGICSEKGRDYLNKRLENTDII